MATPISQHPFGRHACSVLVPRWRATLACLLLMGAWAADTSAAPAPSASATHKTSASATQTTSASATDTNGAAVDPEALGNLLLQDCGSCHGMTLKGGLGPALTQERLAVYDVDTLTTIILEGLPGTAMPPWRDLLSAEEARWIAETLKHTDAQELP